MVKEELFGEMKWLLLFLLFSGLSVAAGDEPSPLPYGRAEAVIEMENGKKIWVFKITRQSTKKVEFLHISNKSGWVPRTKVKKIHVGRTLQLLKHAKHKELLKKKREDQPAATKDELFAKLDSTSINRHASYRHPKQMEEMFGLSKTYVDQHRERTSKGFGLRVFEDETWTLQYRPQGDFKFWLKGAQLNVLTFIIGGQELTVGAAGDRNKGFEVNRTGEDLVIWDGRRRKKMFEGKIKGDTVTIAVKPAVVPTIKRKRDKETGGTIKETVEEVYRPLIREAHIWCKIAKPAGGER